jgi:hypothetical protein
VRIGLQRLQAPELVSTPGECGTEQGPALRWQGANLAGPSAFQRCSLRCAELILFRIVFGLRGGTVGCVSRSHFPPDVQADPNYTWAEIAKTFGRYRTITRRADLRSTQPEH